MTRAIGTKLENKIEEAKNKAFCQYIRYFFLNMYHHTNGFCGYIPLYQRSWKT